MYNKLKEEFQYNILKSSRKKNGWSTKYTYSAKIAMAGVMPVIFASSFMTFPAMIIQIFVQDIANQTGF
ncbi:MAG: hypothetical protein ACLRWM_02460 [Streptococcus sp.]